MVMIEYSFRRDSVLDKSLSKVWTEVDDITPIAWFDFLESLPGVKKAQWDTRDNRVMTHLFFDNEEELTMFLLRWV